MSQPSSRQELYDRIRQSSKQEVILEEMIRLGFWPEGEALPKNSPEELKKESELSRQLQELHKRASRLGNVEALKKEARKRRMELSKAKQKETKERREAERIQRAKEWELKKSQDITYLGESSSSGLNYQNGSLELLQKQNLPVFSTAGELSQALGITINQLRFLSFQRKVSKVSHYIRFSIPKKTGGLRKISAPKPQIKEAQHWIQRELLHKVELHPAAHGFVPGRSIISNAKPHVDQDVVVNLDLQDFFPTITYPRVKGVFRKLGYSNQVATILASICTEPTVKTIELDSERYYVAQGERLLPQGAPTSPAITNIICRRLDARLTKIAIDLGFKYTRYADDLSFSGSGEASQQVGQLLRRVRFVVSQEGFIIHPSKTRIFRKGRRQEVTGLVVNQDHPRIPKDLLRKFRAVLFQVEKDGPKDKCWGNNSDILAALYGFAHFIKMVEPKKGLPLLERVLKLLKQHQRDLPTTPPPPRKPEAKPAPPIVEAGRTESISKEAKTEPEETQESEQKKKPWWKFW